ncbi:MAG: pseudouridine synthase [Planctomycetota bacterium]|jgi:23S rRNA pseudouridine2605 synthase
MKRKKSSKGETDAGDGGPVRLHKYLARCGAGSRRTCETFIAQGRVQVDGVVVDTPGHCVVPGAQEVRLDGAVVRQEKTVYYLVHKPKGYLCSHAASYAPRRVVDLLAKDPRRLFFAGRLDAESEGLVFVTNDGETAQRLAHPSHGVSKTYRVRVRGRVTAEKAASLRKGVFLAEGKVTPNRLRILGRGENSTDLEVGISEGRNREIRRIFAKVGHPVRKLTRVAIGPFLLGNIAPGKVRELTAAEVKALLGAPDAGGKRKRKKKSWAKAKKRAGRGRKKGKRGRKG